MLNYFIGNLGHFFVLLSFVTALVSSFAYARAAQIESLESKNSWTGNGRFFFIAHFIAVTGVVVTLFTIIFGHYFEYHYAYAHSSRHLASSYMVSCFWEGQEGSFLLWMFWQALIGVVLIVTRTSWEAPVMTIFSLVQGFLASMILGVVIPLLEIKIGSSPFILLRDALSDPIFKLQPDFIPKDGNGLNPLLQNYWMVIHPPTLFLGFALTLVPFSYVIAGLWLKEYTAWIKPAIRWSLVGGAILGLGILMGGYWAYETLSFGGYWNWDPVENAVYVPWIILIASLHTLTTYERSKAMLRLSMILVILVFILILYSTFLTRSGILGEASVHSFTDLGLSGQLLIYLLFFTIWSIILLVMRWKSIPAVEKELSAYDGEFWVFLGASVLFLMGFHVLVMTSMPVYNEIAELFGFHPNFAPPSNQIAYYSGYQLWFAAAVAIISGTAQFFWWRRVSTGQFMQHFSIPFLITLALFVIIMVLGSVTKPELLVLALAGSYIIVSNGYLLVTVLRKNPRLSGGAVAHIGVGMMLIGILFSAGYSKVVSLNNTGMLYNREMSTEFNRDNLLLFVNEPRRMAGYDIEYLGERIEPRRGKGYIKPTDVQFTPDPYKVVAKKEILFEGQHLYNPGDSIEIAPENTFYEIRLSQNGSLAATLYPRVQINKAMGGFLASPDIRRQFNRDLYTHVSAPMNKEAEPDWSKMEEVRLKIGQQFFVNDYVAVLQSVERITSLPGLNLGPDDVGVRAVITVQGEHDSYDAETYFLIRNRLDVARLPFEINDLGARFTLLNIHPETNEFTLGLETRQKNWVIIKAIEMPWINILWLGTGVLIIGFTIALVRRSKSN